MELPYRGVSVQPYDGEMTEAAITAHLLGREAYRRTNVIVLRGMDDAYALAAIGPRDREPLFAPIDHVEVLALPGELPSSWSIPRPIAPIPRRWRGWPRQSGIGADGTLICQGKYDHVNFIHHPDPLVHSGG